MTRNEILSRLDEAGRTRVADLLARPATITTPILTLAGALEILAEEANAARKPFCSCRRHLHAHYPFGGRCTDGGDATQASVDAACALRPDYTLAELAEGAGL